MSSNLTKDRQAGLLVEAFQLYEHPVLFVDLDFNVVLTNEAFQKLWASFGVPYVRSLTLLENLEAAATLPPVRHEANEWLALFRSNIELGERYTLSCPNSSILSVTLSPGGEDHLKVITMIDVTETYEATRSLEHSEYRYRLLVETINEGLVLLDANRLVVYANPRFLELYGGNELDVIGRDMANFTTHEMRPRLIHLLHASKSETVEFPLVCKENSQRHVLLSVSPFRDPEGNPSGFFATITDITALRRASERQKQSEARYSSIIENTPFGIMTLGEGGQILSANPAFTSLVDSGSQAIVHSSADYWLPEMSPPLHEMMQSLRFNSTNHSISATSRIRSHQTNFGHARLVLSRINLVDEGYVMIVEDISEHHQMEQALLHASKLALLGEMSASMAHEISQPMNIIRLAAENALINLNKGQTDHLQEKLETISDQSDRLRQTVDHMQAFSRRENSAPYCFNVIDVVHNTLDMFEPRCIDSDIRVTHDFPDAPIYTLGYPRHLEQVLLNLCHNAADSILERRLKSPIEVDEVHISVALSTPPQTLEIAVTDSGTGIRDEDLHLLFEPFFTRKMEGSGTGLGLSISLGLIHGMKGDIAVSNRPEGGCCFSVTLPVSEAPPLKALGQIQHPQTQQNLPVLSSGAMTIMVVDDEPLVLREIAVFLEQAGHKVVLANSGNRARRQLRNYDIDVLITDLQMPHGDGYGLIAEVANEYPHIGIIVSTGQPLRDRLAIADLESGADAILHKPISLRELAQTIEGLA